MHIENNHGPNPIFDEHGIAKPVPHPSPKLDSEHPGYETTDVNTRGVVVFLAGLMAFLVVFFVLCFAMGKAINFGVLKQDSDQARLHPSPASNGGKPMMDQKRVNMADNPYMEQKESARVAASFPTPRLEADDSNQSMADLHAREDLLLDHTTSSQDGSVRLPIDYAMELIVKRGLPMAPGSESHLMMAGDQERTISRPLTNGFARTSYELDQMEIREQKMRFAGPTVEAPKVPTVSMNRK